MGPVLVVGLGAEAAAILARVKALWEKIPTAGALLAIGPSVPGLGDHDVAPFERDGQDLPHAALATALAGLGGGPEVVVVCDLAEAEASFLAALGAEMRRALGPARRIAGVVLLPGPDEPEFVRGPADKILSNLWPVPAAPALFDRLYLAEETTEAGAPAARDALREAVALRLAFECSSTPAADALRTRSDALGGLVRSLGGVALRYPGRAVAELAAARLGAALVEGWCGSTTDAGGPLPDDLPIDEDALDFSALTPEATAEIEAFLDELVWSLRGRFPQLPALAAALPAELTALEQIQFSAAAADGKSDGELDVFVREPKPRSVLEGARERLARQVQVWRNCCEAELVDRCRPVFLEGGGLSRGLAFLDALVAGIEHLEGSLAERERLGEARQTDAKQLVDGAISELGAAARKTLFKSQAVTTAFAGCRRASLLYLTTRAESLLLADFRTALADIVDAVAEMRERVLRVTGVLTYVQHGLEDKAAGIAQAWHAPNLLDPGDPEQAYRDVVGTLPDEEAHLGSLHEDFVAGGSVLDLPIHPGDEQHLVDRLHERALLRFPELLEATFGRGLAQRLPTQAMRAERLSGALDAAMPLLRLAPGSDGALPGKSSIILAHEPNPPAELRAALERMAFPTEHCVELPKKLADHVVVLTERGDFPPGAIRAAELQPIAAPGPDDPAPAPKPVTELPPEPELLAQAAALLAEPERPTALLPPPPGQTLDPAAIDAALDQMLGEVDGVMSQIVPLGAPAQAPAADDGDGLLAKMLADEDPG